MFFEKQDEYSKEETKSILKRIGFNLTHFRDFLDRKRIGNNESLLYRIRSIDTPKEQKEATDLIDAIEK